MLLLIQHTAQINAISSNNAQGFHFVLTIAKWPAKDDKHHVALNLPQLRNET
jgi:hypothetical protein